jgi:multidrug efflux system membrane fusion protein
VQKAEAELALARQAVKAEDAALAEAVALLAQRRAQLDNAGRAAERAQALVAKGFLSPQATENALTTQRTAEEGVKEAQAALEQARAKRGSAGAQNEEIRAAAAILAQAQLDLELTRVVAPAPGSVASLSLRPSDVVQAGAPLFALIGVDRTWRWWMPSGS